MALVSCAVQIEAYISEEEIIEPAVLRRVAVNYASSSPS